MTALRLCMPRPRGNVYARAMPTQALTLSLPNGETVSGLWQSPADPAAVLVLIHGARQLKLDANQPSATFGRDVSNDFVIADVKASRVHARVERRRDKFVIIDQSTNGTFVTADGEPEIGLRREELMLRAKGKIVFGHSAHDDSAEAVRYELK